MTAVAAEPEFPPVALQLRDGRRVTVRSVRPEDREEIQAAIKRLSPESRYTRFMSPLQELSRYMLDRAVSPAPGRELQLVAVSGEKPRPAIVAGARYSAGAGSRDCEFALAVADEWQGVGLARQLLEALIDAARARGFERMEGYILASNAPMLGLAKRLGFRQVESPEGPTVRLVQRELAEKVHGG
jgi:GNAT superfamily N-acetyltransferase